jgi:GNAT superfamily N-acetyltransferase
MSQITTRQMTAADVPHILTMVHQLAAHHGDTAILTADILEKEATGPSPWVTVIVAEQGDAIAGYAALCPLTQLQFGLRGMDMHHLFVAQKDRRTGVGTALIRASIQTAQDFECSYLTVGTHPDNHLAGQVYLAAGFDPMPPPGPRFRIRFPGNAAKGTLQAMPRYPDRC